MATIPAKVTYGTRIGAALVFFKLVDDLHSADLGGATDGACREGGAQHIIGRVVLVQFTMHIGYDVHHMAVALDNHEIINGNTTVFGDAADVVAREVNEH